MIDNALDTLSSSLSNHLRNKFPDLKKSPVELEAAGKGKSKNTLRISLASINQDPIGVSRMTMPHERMGGSAARVAAPMSLHLFILVSADFEDYREALKFISASINFFHDHTTFTKTDTPGLVAEKMTVEMLSLNPREQKALWSLMKVEDAPTTIYKVRLLQLEEDLG